MKLPKRIDWMGTTWSVKRAPQAIMRSMADTTSDDFVYGLTMTGRGVMFIDDQLDDAVAWRTFRHECWHVFFAGIGIGRDEDWPKDEESWIRRCGEGQWDAFCKQNKLKF